MTWNPWKLRARMAELDKERLQWIDDSHKWMGRALKAEMQVRNAQQAAEVELEAIHWQRLEAGRKGRESQARKRAEKAERERLVGEFTGAITSEGGL